MLLHKGTQTLETPRLILRPFTSEDAQAMFDNWASNEAVTRYLTWQAHKNVADTRAFLNICVTGYAKPDCYQWAIVLKEQGGDPVGNISVVSHSDLVRKAEVGYCLGQPWWHKGIMSEALLAVIDFLFDEVGMRRIEARHDTRNPNSGAVMRKCGMKPEGTMRQAAWNNQGICDVDCYAILASER